MSRSAAPSTSATNDTFFKTNAYLPFKTLAMQRLSKMLIDGSVTPRRFRLEALHYLIYPQTLSHYRVHQNGWLSTLGQRKIGYLKKSGKLEPLLTKIRALESDESLSPYDRVGIIVETIKADTGVTFIRNGAFRQLMNAKFNEYTLSDNLDDIRSIDDALRILEQAAVPSKPMKVISTFPELFAESSIRTLLKHTVDSQFMFGGDTDSTMPAAVARFIRQLTPERLASGAMHRILEEEVLANVDSASETHARLVEFAERLPKPPTGTEAGNTIALLRFAYETKTDAASMFAKPEFRAAAEALLQDASTTDLYLREWIDRHLLVEYEVAHGSHGRAVKNGDELVALSQGLLAAIKDTKVQHVDSFKSVMIGLSDTYDEPLEKSRHPFIWAIDSLLAVDGNLPAQQYQRECAKVLHGVPISLFPKEKSLVSAAESLQERVRNAVADRFSLRTADNTIGHTFFGKTSGTYVAGAPEISDFKTYLKADGETKVVVSHDDDAFGTVGPALPLHMSSMPTSFRMSYLARRDREVMLGENPHTPRESDARAVLQIQKRYMVAENAAHGYWKKRLKDVDGDNATNLLGPVFNIATGDTALHRLIAKLPSGGLDTPEQDKLAQLVATACRHGADASAVDEVGNSVVHDVLKLHNKVLLDDHCKTVLTALVDQGAHFAGGSHFGVPLSEMIPEALGEDIVALARASIVRHGVVSAITSPSDTWSPPNADSAPRRKSDDLAL